MSPATWDILAELDRRGVALQVDGNKLRFKPQDFVTVELLILMKAHKTELIALLTAIRCDPTPGKAARWMPGDELTAARPGWTPESWASRMEQLAVRCANINPKLSARYLAMAENMRKSGCGDT